MDAAQQPLEQDYQVHRGDVGAHRARPLRAGQQHVERRVQVLLERARDGDGVGQVALGVRLLADPAEKAEEGPAGVGIGGAAARVLDEIADPGGRHRREQLLLGRKVPVDRARSDARQGGDLVERHAVAGRGERLPRGAQHLLAVAQRVGARCALRHGDGSGC